MLGGKGVTATRFKGYSSVFIKLQFKNTDNPLRFVSVPRTFVHDCGPNDVMKALSGVVNFESLIYDCLKGARLRYFRQFHHWSNCHRVNLNITITAQNYRRTPPKHRKDKKGRGWTKLERIEVDCIWINLKIVGPPFFKFTVCQVIHYQTFITTFGKSFSVVM